MEHGLFVVALGALIMRGVVMRKRELLRLLGGKFRLIRLGKGDLLGWGKGVLLGNIRLLGNIWLLGVLVRALRPMTSKVSMTITTFMRNVMLTFPFIFPEVSMTITTIMRSMRPLRPMAMTRINIVTMTGSTVFMLPISLG